MSEINPIRGKGRDCFRGPGNIEERKDTDRVENEGTQQDRVWTDFSLELEGWNIVTSARPHVRVRQTFQKMISTGLCFILLLIFTPPRSQSVSVTREG